jgi:hypothetical protein
VLADLRKLPLSFGTAAALASLVAAPHAKAASAVATPAPTGQIEPAGQVPPIDSGPEIHGPSCLKQTICAVKEKIRWQTPAWTPSQCGRIADAVATSAKRHDLSPTLLLAIMVNESDMNEKAARLYTRDGKVYAKDGGLMAIRCMLDEHERCTNGNVRGVAWKDLMDPVTNIELGARELAHWRDGGGVMSKTIVKLDADGHRQHVTKDVTSTRVTRVTIRTGSPCSITPSRRS